MIHPLARLCGAVLLLLPLAGAAAAAAQSGSSPAAEQEAPPPPPDDPSMRGRYGGPFILQDHTGRTVQDEDFRGKFMLLTFGYTNCADVCPTALQTMARALDLLGDQAKDVQPLFITVDPARDTQAKLREYVAAFHPSLLGLTGPEAYVAAAARKYRIRYEMVPGKAGEYSVDHTAAIFLMGKDGQFLERFPYSVGPEKLAERLRLRLTAVESKDEGKSDGK